MNTDKYDELINNKEFLTETFDGLMKHKMIKIEKNYVETEIEINKTHLQPFGLVHGGVYSAMAESVSRPIIMSPYFLAFSRIFICP